MNTLKFRPDWNRLGVSEHVPGWFGAYTWTLKHGDHDAAILIRCANDPAYAQGFNAGRLAQIQMSNEMFAELQIGIKAGV